MHHWQIHAALVRVAAERDEWNEWHSFRMPRRAAYYNPGLAEQCGSAAREQAREQAAGAEANYN